LEALEVLELLERLDTVVAQPEFVEVRVVVESAEGCYPVLTEVG
jgi:hypothetical protein